MPPKNASTASTTNGKAITQGDSCGSAPPPCPDRGVRQMLSDRWLTQTGAELLVQVANVRPVFLVELDVTADQVKDLYHHIARSRTLWTPEARMCLAVAAVQSASRANQDEDSFRELFFDRLKRPFDQHGWENRFRRFDIASSNTSV